ncbi:LAFE_0E08460g1_1 [Lachancea fermentati]|uniref:LAFE_0E08460g1_1 n=1 Tax=Lachancea fermentati TaxID=4955 RepID=A0A1G4MD89_LACFM|nr:LAFE_0E08460g1_1 [Lachancea fermentati]
MTSVKPTEHSKSEFRDAHRHKKKAGRPPFANVLSTCRKVVGESKMLQELVDKVQFHIPKIDKVRCLAIGSFHEDQPALYQFALLLEICEIISEQDPERPIQVSIYDPVFTDEDKEFIGKMGHHWSIDESSPWKASQASEVFFFLPHAPLDLTEHILSSEEPRLLLANHVVQHTDRYTKSRLFNTYPLMSKLLNSLSVQEDANDSSINNFGNDEDASFTPFVSRKNRRKSKIKYQEPTIDYDSVRSYFTKCTIVSDFQNGSLLRDMVWLNAFSDLSLHVIE